jgi:hypothetical protein
MPIMNRLLHRIKLRTINIIWLALILFTCNLLDDKVIEDELIKIHNLPDEINESSGMVESGNLLWIINDSGNEPMIYGYNYQQNTIERRVFVADAVNTDWEELTQDAGHFYIGDFGNNVGDRKDLRIYIIDKTALQTSDTVTPSGVIGFSFEDQTDFTPANQNTSFDCEAFIVIDDSLVLFTKDWLTEQTKLYKLPAKSGTYSAEFIKQFDASGLVTASAYNTENKTLLLLGYRDYIPFIWEIPDFSLDNLTFNHGSRSDFTEFLGAQTESIAIMADGSIYVASEESPLVSASFFRVELY